MKIYINVHDKLTQFECAHKFTDSGSEGDFMFDAGMKIREEAIKWRDSGDMEEGQLL